ncbi:MAG: helix-turn-helix transcriptional regulator [Martelella sp.]|uniref:helix-turn-helix domain-containing protein n=1 Tax=Martelella sp. TaxID=1969699 RepID=UPI000C45FF03|nr:hypothetical protein [Nocardioides sp.]|tara:strand:+ start:2572 stop:2952 length:381 start_codon:yes stop_codon:yes gene_type:complete
MNDISVEDYDLMIGRELARLRWLAGCTQEQLAKRLHISQQQIWKYEHGRSRLPTSRAVEIAIVLGFRVPIFLQELGRSLNAPLPEPKAPTPRQRLLHAFSSTEDMQTRAFVEEALMSHYENSRDAR